MEGKMRIKFPIALGLGLFLVLMCGVISPLLVILENNDTNINIMGIILLCTGIICVSFSVESK
jgi:hypothetical protein